MRLLVGCDAEVGRWIGSCLGQEIVPPFGAIGILNDAGELVGGWVVGGYNGFNADLTIYAPGAMTRRTIRACYAHLFVDLGCIRVTASTRRDNKTMRDLITRLGFKFECVQRRYYGPLKRDDAFVYALFPDQARKWLPLPALDVRNSGTTNTISARQISANHTIA
jgi:RimJ/RimL family protein N-acetyltransferase